MCVSELHCQNKHRVMLTTILKQHTREQCATAAMSRAEWPAVNLLGLDNSEAEARRRRCHEATLLRFLMPAPTVPEVQYSKARKRESSLDREIVNQTLLDMYGNDSWSPLLCGYAHKLKRPKLQLCDDVVRKAMLGMS